MDESSLRVIVLPSGLRQGKPEWAAGIKARPPPRSPALAFGPDKGKRAAAPRLPYKQPEAPPTRTAQGSWATAFKGGPTVQRSKSKAPRPVDRALAGKHWSTDLEPSIDGKHRQKQLQEQVAETPDRFVPGTTKKMLERFRTGPPQSRLQRKHAVAETNWDNYVAGHVTFEEALRKEAEEEAARKTAEEEAARNAAEEKTACKEAKKTEEEAARKEAEGARKEAEETEEEEASLRKVVKEEAATKIMQGDQLVKQQRGDVNVFLRKHREEAALKIQALQRGKMGRRKASEKAQGKSR